MSFSLNSEGLPEPKLGVQPLTTDAAELLEYCARLLDLYAACAAESLGVDIRTERALLSV